MTTLDPVKLRELVKDIYPPQSAEDLAFDKLLAATEWTSEDNIDTAKFLHFKFVISLARILDDAAILKAICQDTALTSLQMLVDKYNIAGDAIPQPLPTADVLGGPDNLNRLKFVVLFLDLVQCDETLTAIIVADKNLCSLKDFVAKFSKLTMDDIKTKLDAGASTDAGSKKIKFLVDMADLFNCHEVLVSRLARDTGLLTIRDIAAKYSCATLIEMATRKWSPGNPEMDQIVGKMFARLFVRERCAVFQRMASAGELSAPAVDSSVWPKVSKFFQDHPDFNITSTSILDLAKDLKESKVKEQLLNLQRLQPLTTSPESIKVLLANGFKSAYQITCIPPKQFVQVVTVANQVGEEEARQIHSEALKTRMKHEDRAVRYLDTIGGRGLRVLSNPINKKPTGSEKDVLVNLRTLFGSLDFTDFKDRPSILSPAAYFVELLQFLAVNNTTRGLGSEPVFSPLELLLRRRPDLAHLKLNTANTDTIIPYIDLANEIMESFIENLPDYNTHKKIEIQGHDFLQGEVVHPLAAPVNVKYNAYNTLSTTIHPFTLPYHRPLDEIRQGLQLLGTSRHEILEASLSLEIGGGLQRKREVDAEFLGLGEVEYEILVKEGFTPKSKVTETPIHTCWGYLSEEEMLDAQVGLIHIQAQFLPRAGISFVDLAALLKTRFINPHQLQGWEQSLLGPVGETYRFLQARVMDSPFRRYEMVIALIRDNLKANNSNSASTAKIVAELETWVPKNFDRIGKIIMMEKGEKLEYLSGDQLEVDAFDRMQKFLRLWKLLGWTMKDVDRAIHSVSGNVTVTNKEPVKRTVDITPWIIEQLSTLQKLLTITKHPLVKLTSLWMDIGTAGDMELYSEIFLRTNIAVLHPVFKLDEDGRVLLNSKEKLGTHKLGLMAALQIKSAQDFSALLDVSGKSTEDNLNLYTISSLYRHSLLAVTLGVSIQDLLRLKRCDLFNCEPFASPSNTFQVLNLWKTIQSAGLTPEELEYLIHKVQPALILGPTKVDITALTKSVQDGLTVLDHQDHDTATASEIEDLFRYLEDNLGLILSPSDAKMVLDLVTGTTKYSTKCSKQLETSAETAKSLPAKVRYNPNNLRLDIRGRLTPAEERQTKDSFLAKSHDVLVSALKELTTQAQAPLTEILAGFIPTNVLSDAQETLLEGDDPKSALKKAQLLHTHLRHYVLADKLFVETISATLGLSTEIVAVLLKELRIDGSRVSCMDFLQETETNNCWADVLLPPTSDKYTFTFATESNLSEWQTVKAKSTKGKISDDFYLLLNEESYKLSMEPAAPEGLDDRLERWSTEAIELISGHPYTFQPGPSLIHSKYEWKTSRSMPKEIPPTAFVPAWKTLKMAKVMEALLRRAMIINKLKLDLMEVDYIFRSPNEGFRIAVDSFKLEDMRKLATYINFRKDMPPKSPVIDFFRWAVSATPSQVSANILSKLEEVTGWIPNQIKQLQDSLTDHNVWQSLNFASTDVLIGLRRLFAICQKAGVDFKPLLASATQKTSWTEWLDAAEALRQSLRAKFNLEDWVKAIKPMSNKIRERSRNAMIVYLLSQPEIQARKIYNADALFGFFLIDVQMSACLETSRLKQAISTVQLFVQRCLLRIEDGYPLVDRKRWSTLELQTLHAARRNVFLFPENYLHPSLRDNKSPLFVEFESQLMQKDLTDQNVGEAIKNYLGKLVEIADLQVNGLFYDELKKSTHVVASTRNSPPGYYYRAYNGITQEWTPWQKIPVDIPRYISGDTEGTHVIPFVVDGHVIIAFPTFEQGTPGKTESKVSMQNTGDQWIASEVKSALPPGLKIRISWIEYRDGKWGPKQFSTRFITHTTGSMADVQRYTFLTHFHHNKNTSSLSVRIHAFHSDASAFTPFGGFDYTMGTFIADDDVTLKTSTADTKKDFIDEDLIKISRSFHYKIINELQTMHASQLITRGGQDFIYYGNQSPYVRYLAVKPSTLSKFHNYKAKGTICIDEPDDFYHPFITSISATVGVTTNVDEIFKYYSKSVLDTHVPGAFGQLATGAYNELKGSYSLYNWELAFHIPMAVAERLRVTKQYQKALDMLHHIFNPFEKETRAQTPEGHERYWKFKPFQNLLGHHNSVEDFLGGLEPGMSDSTIEAWRENPFDPHVIARSRPIVYMKWVVMLYIKILLEYGDYYFRQNSMESMPRAIQIYVLAAHLFGPKPEPRPEQGNVAPRSYHELKDCLDSFDNAIVRMELEFPYSNQSLETIVSGIPNDVHLPNIFGFASSPYFYIPANPELQRLRGTIDDRLFKLRNCQDIDGVLRRLPLFDAPIDPQLLVQATSQGLSVASLITDLNSPAYNYRFPALLRQALEAAAHLSALANLFLSVKATRETEALARLRATYDCQMHDLNLLVLNGKLDEAGKTKACLRHSRNIQVQRLKYFLQLTGDNLSQVPNENADFQEIAQSLSEPIGSSGHEKDQLRLALASVSLTGACAIAQGVIAYFAALPDVDFNTAPLGVGTTFRWGPKNLVTVASGEAQAVLTAAGALHQGSQVAGLQASFERQLQSYRQEANATGLEIKYIDQQMLSQEIRIQMAKQEVENQQVTIEQAREMEAFLRSKYTNTELYSWMESELKTLHYRYYTMAFELAKGAENAYHFERPLEKNRKFIEFGHWDTSHDGLLSGEHLFSDLGRLQAAYQSQKGHDYEISKHISLRQLDPLAIFNLRQNAVCNFELPEVLFDMDFPGHYNRRIKSVSITLPCIVGPYMTVNGTLRLLEHKYRISPSAEQPYNSLADTTQPDDRFAVARVPIDAIAVSSAHMDPGVFELTFHDERYMPFEGAGAISNWEFQLPSGFRQFDYESITDVLLHIRYTSVEGGSKLKTIAEAAMLETLKMAREKAQDGGLWTVLDIRHDYPDEWNQAVNTTKSRHPISLSRLKDRLPNYTKTLSALSAVEVVVLSTKEVGGLTLLSNQGGSFQWPNEGDQAKNPEMLGKLFRYNMKATSTKLQMDGWTLTLENGPSEADSMCILIHYVAA